MDRLETRELDSFLAVAQERHFGRAAERLGITQPPLSRAIRRLEDRLGVVLFERTSRRVELTRAGEALRERAADVLAALDGTVAAVREAGEPRMVRIAAAPGTGAGVLRHLVGAWRGTGRVEIVFTREQARAVRAGTADFTVLCATDDLRGLQTKLLLGWRRGATIADADALIRAARDAVNDLALVDVAPVSDGHHDN